jgi:acetyltransferase-like isoleucine patch superfamily enzyme
MEINKNLSEVNSKYNPFTWIVGEPEIGEGTWIGAFTVIDGSGGLKIGKKCDISSGVQIYSHSSVRRCVSSRKFEAVETESTVIGDNVFIGANSTILMGVTIGNSSVVGAGSLVNSSIPSMKVYAGIPAVEIGDVVINGSQVDFIYHQ